MSSMSSATIVFQSYINSIVIVEQHALAEVGNWILFNRLACIHCHLISYSVQFDSHSQYDLYLSPDLEFVD